MIPGERRSARVSAREASEGIETVSNGSGNRPIDTSLVSMNGGGEESRSMSPIEEAEHGINGYGRVGGEERGNGVQVEDSDDD